MRKSNKYDRMWGHPEFKRVLKAEAALCGKSLYDYTEELAKKRAGRLKIPDDQQKREEGFKFGF